MNTSYFTNYLTTCSRSRIQLATHASLGIRQSPLGDSATVPTFGPSGRQERLNCCAKNLQQKVLSHLYMVSSSYSPANEYFAIR